MRRLGCAILFLTLVASAQEPQFEVASVKPSGSRRPSRFMIQPGGRVDAGNITVRGVIQRAYGVRVYAIDGLPPWALRDEFDIQAKGASRDDPYGSIEVLAMSRSLLRERFGLAAHRETRVRPVYLLVREHPERPLSPNLRPSSIDCAGRRPEDTGLPAGECGLFAVARPAENTVTVTYRGRSLADFANDLASRVERPVLDRTDIPGQFDVELVSERGQDVFTPLREQLGLRLVAAEAPVEMLVVDAIHPPTPD